MQYSKGLNRGLVFLEGYILRDPGGPVSGWLRARHGRIVGLETEWRDEWCVGSQDRASSLRAESPRESNE